MWQLNPPNRAEFIVLVILLPITTLVVLLRLLALRRTKRKPALEDWFAFGAWAAFLVHDATVLMSLKITGDKNPLGTDYTDPGAFEQAQKLTFVASLLYIAQQWFTKLSLAALYLRLFSIDASYRRAIYALIAVQTAWFFIPFFIQLFTCNPIEKFWMPFLVGTCANQGTVIAILESVNSPTGFASVILAMLMIRGLNMSRANKARLGVLFGLGALAGILGVVKIVLTYKGDEFYSFALVGFLSNIQMAVGIICCCVPVLTPLLPAQGMWFRLSSIFSRRRKPYRTGASGSKSDSTPGSDSSTKRSQGWQHIQEDSSSIQGLSWDVSTHQFETHAMSSISPTSMGPTRQGIQVQRRVDVDHVT